MVPILNTIVLITKAFVYYKVITLSTIAVNKLMASSFVSTIRSVGVLKGAMQGLSAMATKVGQAIQNNIAGIAILLLANLYFEYKRIADIEAIATNNAEELANATAEVANKTSIEAEEMTNLFDALKNTNNGSVERTKLIDEINGRYGTTLKNLGDEKAFVDQVTTAYGQLMKQLEAKAEMELVRTKYEVSGRQFAEVQMEADKALADLQYYQDNTSTAGWLLDSLLDHFGATSENELIEISNAMQRQKTTAKELYEKYKADYLAMQVKVALTKPVTPTPSGSGSGSGGTGTGTGTTKPKEVQDYELELATFNSYVEKRIALEEQLRALKAKANFGVKESGIEAQINNIVLATKQLALAGKDAFPDMVAGEMFDATERAIIDLYDSLKEEQVAQTDFEISEVKRKYAEEKALEEQKLKDDYASKVDKYTKDRAKMVKDIASGDEVAGSLTKMDEAKKKLDAEYALQQQKLADDNVKRVKDEELEIAVIVQNGADAEVQIEKDKNEKIDDYNEKRNVAYEEGVNERQAIADKDAKDAIDKAEDELEKAQQRRKDMDAVVEASADFFIAQSNKKIAQIEKELELANQAYAYYQKLAEEGNINAQQSLAEQQKIINEANKKKAMEEKKQAYLELAKTAYSTYQSKVDAKSKNPLADTIKDITLLQAFIKTIPAFEEGTEDTGTSGRGVDGRGGFHAILHPNERVVPKSLNEQIGDLTNTELANMATNYRAGKIGQSNQSGSALDLAILVNEIKDLKTIIKNKPETNIELGEITASIMEVVQSTTKGNETTYNRFKIRK
jgi:hypothetical protein